MLPFLFYGLLGNYFYKPETGVLEEDRRAVYVLRNPFKTILAFWNWEKGGHTGLAKPNSFETKGNVHLLKPKSPACGSYKFDLRVPKKVSVCILQSSIIISKKSTDMSIRRYRKMG